MEKDKITFKGKSIGECSRDELEEMILRLIKQRNKYRNEAKLLMELEEIKKKMASWGEA